MLGAKYSSVHHWVYLQKGSAIGARKQNWEWKQPELERYFQEAIVASAQRKPVTTILDALDEVGEQSAPELVTHFNQLEEELAVVDAKAKFYISSRHYPVLSDSPGLGIHMEAHNGHDIALFINNRLRWKNFVDHNYPKDQDAWQNLALDLTEMTHGVFLWVELIVPLVKKTGQRWPVLGRGLPLDWGRLPGSWQIPMEELEDPEKLIESLRRGIWEGQSGDKRARNEQQVEAKRRKIENGEDVKTPVYATHFSQEDIDNEQRRPKKKVAVLLGYSGTGYKGMQLSDTEKTIEGELFAAFVAAGAISKANAADPKKSSLVRCARTDKGVHAAGNIVSLKMILEGPATVHKINEQLSSQIRIWDILVANKSFSSYQMCDSRIYEYLIPSYCFLPPHPSTYLGKKVSEIAEKHGDLEGLATRQAEVADYWAETDEKHVRPILEKVNEDIRKLVQKALYFDEEKSAEAQSVDKDVTQSTGTPENGTNPEMSTATENPDEQGQNMELDEAQEAQRKEIYETVKAVKAAYNTAKRAYRIPAARMARIQETLDKYVGTRNFYNYTIQKMHSDPSAKRHIKSFKVDPNPVIINGTEWLSLKVHGQSFMMHQIRKMVAMVALIVRCGCDPQRIVDSYGPTKIAIPKAPGLGLLLERPVFDVYNKKASETNKQHINFDNYAKEIGEFKQREIYDRIFREEEESNAFSSFFNHVDHFPQEEFLYITSGGITAAKPLQQGSAEVRKEDDQTGRKSQREALAIVEADSDNEANIPDGGEEGG
ncbi:tRNA pseudouridine synthase 1 [Aspergillus melleus]|uniref:tRNA pseudouridine synthase 1 n=1 Tax=Aspergillus melleus TaxID=138277 RepID=A0ACC3AUL4_9EURO|nr:tRNA pseudouridine synthase 1 [Aspergillus melleus]